MWSVQVLDEVEEWYLDLAKHDPDAADAVEAAIDLLESEGPTLGRPLVDRLKGAAHHNMKELRPRSTNIRILFVFDPERQAVLLVGGDKTGNWKEWYRTNIPVAERRYRLYLQEEDHGEAVARGSR